MKTELRGEGLLIQDTDVDIVIMCDKYKKGRRKRKKDSIIASTNQWKDLEKYVQGRCPERLSSQADLTAN